jgi:LmbE family N-acetylglucosaminyl deacetylase
MGSLIGVDEQGEGEALGVTTCVDVSPYIHQKVAAIAAHRSQYAIEVDMFPLSIMQELMGMEYFVRVYPTPRIKRELFPLLFTTSV